MTAGALGFIDNVMAAAGIQYEYMEYSSDVEEAASYWVGSYLERVPVSEDGMTESQFVLTGTAKGTWYDLEQQKEVIRGLFPESRGKTAILADGAGIAVFYENAFPVPTGDAFLKRLQINLLVKEWKES